MMKYSSSAYRFLISAEPRLYDLFNAGLILLVALLFAVPALNPAHIDSYIAIMPVWAWGVLFFVLGIAHLVSVIRWPKHIGTRYYTSLLVVGLWCGLAMLTWTYSRASAGVALAMYFATFSLFAYLRLSMIRAAIGR